MNALRIGDNNYPFRTYTPEKFIEDFKAFTESNFSIEASYKLHKYSFYYGRICALGIMPFVVPDFINNPLYTENIQKMFDSKTYKQRYFAYKLISGLCDSSFEKQLLKRLDTTSNYDELFEITHTLMKTKTSHTSAIFDVFMRTNFFNDYFDLLILPYFIRLDKHDLLNTFYEKVNDNDSLSRVTCARIVTYTDLNKKTETILKNAVSDWCSNEKMFALCAIHQLRIGNLKETIVPLLDSIKFRQVALELLAGSPTESDREYVYQIIDAQDTLSAEYLNCLLFSGNQESLKYWIQLLYTKPISIDYIFQKWEVDSLSSDSFLPHIQTALEKVDRSDFKYQLIQVLEGRNDQRSDIIFLNYLDSKEAKLREITANTMISDSSMKLREKAVELLHDKEKRVYSLVNFVIHYKIDTLQNLMRMIYYDNLKKEDNEWSKYAYYYLSVFPDSLCHSIFLEKFKDKYSGFSEENTIEGLAKLNDTIIVDYLIDELNKDERFMFPWRIEILEKINTKKAIQAAIMFREEEKKRIEKEKEIRKKFDELFYD